MNTYIQNPKTIDEIVNNANVQMGNIEYYISIKDYQSALIKANCLVKELQHTISSSVCLCDKPEFVKDTFIGIIFCNKCAKDKEQTDY